MWTKTIITKKKDSTVHLKQQKQNDYQQIN